jgi:uncharacterized protein
MVVLGRIASQVRRARVARRALEGPTGGHTPFILLGLALALFGPPLLALGARAGMLGEPSSGVGLVAYAVLVAVVLCIARLGERVPLASLGLRLPCASTPVTAIALAAVYIFVVAPLMSWSLGLMGSAGFEQGLRTMHAMPKWLQVVSVVVGVAFEELLYRGYAFERLGQLTGSRLLGGALCALVFALAHAPLWGIDVGIILVLPAVVATLAYHYRRDLVANVLAHVATDLLGIVSSG